MKKVQLTLLIVAVFGLSSAMAGETVITPEWRQQVLSHHTQFPTVQTTYHVQDFSLVNAPQPMKERWIEELNEYSRILQQRAAGTLSADEQERYSEISSASLEKMVQERETYLRKAPEEAVQVMTVNHDRYRRDLFRETVQPNKVLTLFDGMNWSVITPDDQRIRTGEGIGQNYDFFLKFAVYGSGLHTMLTSDYHVEISEEGLHFTAWNRQMDEKGFRAQFTLYEPNPVYWQKCVILQNGTKIARHVCEDFTNVNGKLIPSTVKEQKWLHGGWQDQRVFTLMDAKVNDDVQLQEGFFETPSADSFELVRLNR